MVKCKWISFIELDSHAKLKESFCISTYTVPRVHMKVGFFWLARESFPDLKVQNECHMGFRATGN